MAKVLLITGEPRVGKTTLLMKLINELRSKGYVVGGMITKEVRGKHGRIGFIIHDLNSGKRGELASVKKISGPRVGKYFVNLKDLAEVGAKSLVSAINECDFIICDEIGPMELHSPEFRRAVLQAVSCGKPFICSIHWKLRDPVINEVKKLGELIEVTYSNRDSLLGILLEKALNLLKVEN
jgi:nucleoside-triphosphatase